MGSSTSKPDIGLQRSKTQSSIPMGNNQELGLGRGDIFKQVKGEMKAIERSRSRSDIKIQNQLQKSASKSRFLDEIRIRRSRAQSAHSMTFDEDFNAMKMPDAEEQMKIQKQIEESRLIEEDDEKRKAEEEEEQKNEKEEEERKRQEKRKQINPYDDAPKKMDDIFGPMRGGKKPTTTQQKVKSPTPPPKEPTPPPAYTPSVYTDPDFDPNKKEIAGMSESVKLKKTAKNKKEPTKKDAFESKSQTREKLMANMGKPAKWSKPKPAQKPKEPTPPPVEEKEPTPPPIPQTPPPTPVEKPKEPSPIVLQKEPTPPKEPTPEPPPLSPLPPPEHEEQSTEEYRSPSPTRMLPPKIGINGFNGVGRIVLRAAIESGLDVKAINDPFVPLQYMVYTLKFDLAMSPGGVDTQSKRINSNQSKKQEIYSVRESPTGQLIINGHAISVFVEHDVAKIPWTLAGVNYVVESTDVLFSLADAKLHLSTSKRGVRLRHLIEEEQLRKSQGRESSTSSGTADGDALALMYGGCKNVIVAGPSDDAPLFCVGINDDMSARGGTLGDGKISLSKTSVASHVSAPVAALAPILYLIDKSFKIESCSYTLLRSVKGGPKRYQSCLE